MGNDNIAKDVRGDKEMDNLLPEEHQHTKPGKTLEIQLPNDITEVIA